MLNVAMRRVLCKISSIHIFDHKLIILQKNDGNGGLTGILWLLIYCVYLYKSNRIIGTNRYPPNMEVNDEIKSFKSPFSNHANVYEPFKSR